MTPRRRSVRSEVCSKLVRVQRAGWLQCRNTRERLVEAWAPNPTMNGPDQQRQAPRLLHTTIDDARRKLPVRLGGDKGPGMCRPCCDAVVSPLPRVGRCVTLRWLQSDKSR